MLKKVKKTRVHNNQNSVRRGKRVNKNIRHSRKHTKKNLHLHLNSQDGGFARNGAIKDKFQVTTFRSINQDDLDRFKISNYVNKNIDWGILPRPPPTDCCIM